jgi:hypothetical protein
MNCVHHFAQETPGGPIVCKNCGQTPAVPTTVNVSTSSTTSNVLQGCGCLVIGVILLIVIIVII